MADLGHTTLDSADEYDYDESTDILNYAPEGTPERVSLPPLLLLLLVLAVSKAAVSKTAMTTWQ